VRRQKRAFYTPKINLRRFIAMNKKLLGSAMLLICAIVLTVSSTREITKQINSGKTLTEAVRSTIKPVNKDIKHAIDVVDEKLDEASAAVAAVLKRRQVNITYYVDNVNGSDSNDGKSTYTPWKTIKKVNSFYFKAGDIIKFKRGGVWREQLNISSSGISGSPIIFTAYGTGNKPKISALDVITGWTKEGVIYYKPYSSRPSSVVVNGKLIGNVKVKSGVAAGKWWYDSANRRIYIGDNPITNLIEVSSLNRQGAVRTNGKSYVTVDGLDLMGSGAGGQNYTVYVGNGSANFVIKNSNIHDSFGGLSVQSAVGNYGTIQGNQIYNVHCNGVTLNTAKTSYVTGWAVRGNDIHHCGILGEQVLQTASGQDLYSQGMFGVMKDIMIESNKIHDITNGSLHDNQNVDHRLLSHALYWANTKMTIRYNLFYNCSNTGIKLNGYCHDSQIYYNVSRNNMNGMLVYGSTGVKVYNNVFANNTNGGILLFDYGGVASVISDMKNNIFYKNASGQVKKYNTSRVAVSDYNCYFGISGSDPHGLNADPKFVNPAGFDFRLQSTSPCINRGIHIGLTRDLQGKAISGIPDIGAYEY
jgi:hypothetical protein